MGRLRLQKVRWPNHVVYLLSHRAWPLTLHLIWDLDPFLFYLLLYSVIQLTFAQMYSVIQRMYIEYIQHTRSVLSAENTPENKGDMVPAFLLSFFFFFFCLFRAAPVAYGGSQARGRISVVATGLYHSHTNVGSELSLQPTPPLTAMPDP